MHYNMRYNTLSFDIENTYVTSIFDHTCL